MKPIDVCVTLIVPDEVDVTEETAEGESVFASDPVPNETVEAVRGAIAADDRWTYRRVHTGQPDLDPRQHMWIWVTLDSANWEAARRVAQGGVYDVATTVIPGAQFLSIMPE